MNDLGYAILAGLLFALMGLGYKTAERQHCRPLPFTCAFALIACLISGVAALQEGAAWNNPTLWLLGTLIGLALIGAVFSLMAANRVAPASISWTILNLSILVAILPAPFFFDEPFRTADPFVILCFVVMLLCFAKGMSSEQSHSRKNDGGPHATRHPFWALSILFITNGLFNLGNKFKDELLGTSNNAAVACIFYGLCMIVPLTLLIVKRRERPLFTQNDILAGLYTGACSSLGSLCFLRAMALPAAKVFPITCGISLLGGVALISIIYHERMTRWKLIGIAIGTLTMTGAILRDML